MLFDAAIAALAPTQQTGMRIDLGLQAAYDQLVGPAHQPGNMRSIILVTDGIHTGVGQDLDKPLLREIASSPENHYPAPNAEDRVAIYRNIADYIPCPGQP